MDYSGTVDYDVNTPFKYEGDDQDHLPASDGVDSVVDDPSKHMPVHHNQDDLIYPPLDFATPTSHAAASSSHVINSQSSLGNNLPSSSMGLDLASNATVSSASGTIDHILGGTSNAVAMETSGDVAMETSDVRAPSSPESDEIPLAARRQKRPSRSTRSRKSLAEINEEEFDEKPPKGFNLLHDINPALVGTQSIFCSDVQKERRSKLTKGAKKKKKKEPEFCRFCFTNELSLQKIRSAKLPPSSSHPNTKLASLVTSVTDIDLCLSEKWTNPSFQLVCDDCVLVFSQFHEFRSAVQTNDTLLRRLYCSSKAKSKKPPAAAAATPPTAAPVSAATTTASGKGRRRPNYKDPTSEEDSDARSIVSKKKTRGRRKGVTDDEETDGYLSSVSKTSKKSATSRRGASKKKKAGVTSDEETDGYMSSVSKKSTNTTPAAKSNSRKKRRYNSDSDNEDVKSDVSDGMDFGPSAYDYEDDWNNLDEEDLVLQPPPVKPSQRRASVTGGSSQQMPKIKIKIEPEEKSWHSKSPPLEPEVRIKVERDQASTSDNESEAEPATKSSSFKTIISKYVGYNIDDLNTIDKSRAQSVSAVVTDALRDGVKKRRGRRRKSEVREGKRNMRAKTPVPEEKEVKLEKKQKKARKEKREIDLDKKPSDMENVFASLDEESSEEDDGVDEDWDEVHLGHFSPYEFACRSCEVKLNSYEKLLRHIRSDHGSYETSSLCYHCGYYSKNRSTLKNHVRVEHGENNAKRKEKKICDICSAEVVHLAIHKKHSHSGTYHVCPHCGKKFTRKAELQLHIKGIHLKHQLEKTYVCEYCHKEFTFYNYLRRHMRVHTNEKPYKCKDCGAAFNHNVSLKNHKNSSCPKREADATPVPPRRTPQSQLSSNSTSPSHHVGQNLTTAGAATQSVPPATTNSNVRIPKFDRRQTQRSMMEMIQNSATMPTNVTFPAVFDAAHMYYYG